MRMQSLHNESLRNPRRRLASSYGGTMLRNSLNTSARVVMANPACSPDERTQCEHALVNPALNKALSDYETLLNDRFDRVESVLKEISELPKQDGRFKERANQLAQLGMNCGLPESLISRSWMRGPDLPSLFGHCMFQACLQSVANANREQASWLQGMSVDDQFIHECGYHTVDISPCSDGRLQGVLPFVLRVSPFSEAVVLKAYAGALFDIETDIADWTQRELSQRIDGQSGRRYLKIAIYHYSSSAPASQGCAAHNGDEQMARRAAASKLNELRVAIDHAFGPAPGPDVLLIGLDTDLDAIRIHIPNRDGSPSDEEVVDSSTLYKETLSMSAEQGLSYIRKAVAQACQAARSNISNGLKQLIEGLIEVNLSQIEYVIQHHQGRYEDVGHGERFICVGDPVDALQIRNLYYFAHLDTLEEGAACVDVGIHIFEKLNITRGFPIPVIIHFAYASIIPGARQRAIERCERVMHAMIARYQSFAYAESLKFALCVSDSNANMKAGFEIVNTYCVSGAQAQGFVQ